MTRGLAACARLCRLAAGVALATELVLIVALVLARTFAISLPWADELARFTFVWMVALGAASGLHRRSHFALSALSDVAPRSWRGPLERAVAAVAAGLLLVLLLALAESIPAVRYSMMPATGMSRAWLQAPLAVFALLGACFMAAKAFSPREGEH